MKKFIYILLIICGYLYVTAASSWPTKPDLQTRLLEDDELDGQITLHLYHSLEPSDSPPLYTKRGVISINGARSEAVYLEEIPLSTDESQKLKSLAASDDLYRVKLASRPEEPEEDSVFSFTKACSVEGSSDVISITLDQSHVPVGVSVCPSPSNSTLHVVTLLNGPQPDTLTYIQRLEHEKAEKARGEQGDNRSFFAKYWMYIVPFVIILLISGATGPDAQNGR